MDLAAVTESASDLTGIAGWAVDVMETLGGPGAGLAIALENLFPPLPSEVILPLAGFTASRGSFTLVEVLLWTTLGSVAGALALYGLGAWLGRDRLRRIIARVPLMRLSDVDRAEAWFDRHGYRAVFFGRMIPIFRSLISIPARTPRNRHSLPVDGYGVAGRLRTPSHAGAAASLERGGHRPAVNDRFGWSRVPRSSGPAEIVPRNPFRQTVSAICPLSGLLTTAPSGTGVSVIGGRVRVRRVDH